MDLAVQADNRVKLKEIERAINVWTLLENYKESMKHEDDGDSIVIVSLGTIPKGLVNKLEVLEIRGQW